MKSELNVRKHLVWNMAALMTKNRIRSAAELSRRLQAIGFEITSIYLSRIMYDRPARINADLLEGLVNIFDCTASDLLSIEESDVVEAPQPQPVSNVIPLKPKAAGEKKQNKPGEKRTSNRPETPVYPPPTPGKK